MAQQLSIAELRAEAEAMGLEVEDIVTFVYKQQELYRDERAAERAARVEEAERQAGHDVRCRRFRERDSSC